MVASSGGLKVGDLVRRPPLVIHPDSTLLEAVDRLMEHNVGALVVVRREEPDKAVAVLSERDIVRALNMRMALSTPVEAFMSPGVISIEYDQPLSKAAELMWRYNVRHLVVTKGGKLYGVISIRDLIKPESLQAICREGLFHSS